MTSIKGGRPLSRKEREATETALQIIRTTKNNSIKAKMVELLYRYDLVEKARRDAAAERAALKKSQSAEVERLMQENELLRAELERIKPERTPDQILKAAMERLGIRQEN